VGHFLTQKEIKHDFTSQVQSKGSPATHVHAQVGTIARKIETETHPNETFSTEISGEVEAAATSPDALMPLPPPVDLHPPALVPPKS
jgi:hypothetical protein